MSNTRRFQIESKIPKGRMPAPSEIKMGTQFHKVKRYDDFVDKESTECDKCELCGHIDVISNGELLDQDTWVCYSCIDEEAEDIDEESVENV